MSEWLSEIVISTEIEYWLVICVKWKKSGIDI